MARSRDRIDDRWQVSPRRPDGSRGRGGPHVGSVRLTPTRVVLALAIVGALAYIAFALTVRDASQLPMLSSGAAILGIVFAALAVSGGVSMWRAGRVGATRRAIALAIAGGVAGMIAAGCFAAAIDLALVWGQ